MSHAVLYYNYTVNDYNKCIFNITIVALKFNVNQGNIYNQLY